MGGLGVRSQVCFRNWYFDAFLNLSFCLLSTQVCRAWKMLAYDGTLWSNIDVTPFYRNISGEQLQALGIAAGGFLKVANFR